jgi:hypothetical protein
VSSVTPFVLTGNELVALLTHLSPERKRWTALVALGLLTDVEGWQSFSDGSPPSDEIVLRGTQSLLDRGMLNLADGKPEATVAAEAIAYALAHPESILSYQSISPTIEFSSLVVDSAAGYRVAMDFVEGGSYEVSVIQRQESDPLAFFSLFAQEMVSTWDAFLFDITYMAGEDDELVTAFVSAPKHAPDEMVEAFDIDRDGFWVISHDVPFEGDDVKVFLVADDEVPVYRRRCATLSEALDNVIARFRAELAESRAEKTAVVI